MVSIQKTAFSISTALLLSLMGSFWGELLHTSECGQAQSRARRHSSSKRTQHSPKRASSAAKSRQAKKGSSKKKAAAAKPKYAYPLDFFMMKAPDFDRTPLDETSSAKIRDAFERGIADDLAPEKLVRAGVFHFYPLSGGIFNRREDVKYIVLHSTETGIPVPGKNVINGWNSMGRRHPGAQYVVDRDGTIYQALDPKLAAVHVNIFKTLPGINNDNTIGIEMNHTGKQNYPAVQREAVMRLLTYLQQRFSVSSENVITHRYAQQGDHTDPVNFDLDGFLATKENFRTRAIALKRQSAPLPFADEITEDEAPLASVYVQIHGLLPEETQVHKSKLENGMYQVPTQVPEQAIAMPRGTFVAGGALKQGSAPDLED